VIDVSSDESRDLVLRLRGVSKSFDGTTVLKELDLDVKRGETVVLLGENGAGKSTLKNILCGLVKSDGGEIEFNGELERDWSAARAKELGLAAIHQELSLFSNMSVAENVHILELAKGSAGFIRTRRLEAKTDEMFRDLLDIEMDSSQLVSDLPLGQRQLVEIVKAIRSASSVLVLDEPTTSLSMEERQHLFKVMRRLRDSGYALIHVTHFLEEVEQVGNKVAIMRDGEIVAFAKSGELSVSRIEQHMVGRELGAVKREAPEGDGHDRPVVLEVDKIRDNSILQGVSFSLRAGEILGIAGLTGAGRSELMQGIIGIRPVQGDVTLHGKPYMNRSVTDSKKRGLVLVSEDRREEQAFLERSVRENLTAPLLERVSTRLGWIRRQAERELATSMVKKFDVKTDGIESDLGSMSGGNQQKAILARWLGLDPTVCLLDEPTKGIDVGAKAQVQQIIFDLARRGVGVVVVSSDLPELFQVSDRILVMRQGRIAAELNQQDFNGPDVLRAASGGGLEK
jgi:ribose transport system ATP-binding protein